MMDWEDVRVQLIDTPPITADYMEGYLSSMVRAADAALLMVDLGDDDGPFAAEAVLERLAQTSRPCSSASRRPTQDDLTDRARQDAAGRQQDRPAGRRRPAGDRPRDVRRSASRSTSSPPSTGTGLEELRNAIYQFLNVIRVYTKQPGKPPDMTSPFTCPVGSTLVEMAALVHRDFAEKLKSARIWGTGVFDGQTVKRDHVLHDKDVVELHI